MYLLDTNVVSELRKPATRIDEGVSHWVRAQDAERLFLSAVSVLELEVGVLRLERRDARKGTRLRGWLDEVLQTFGDRVLPFDSEAAQQAAMLQVPDPRADHDSFIAATALSHGLTVVTRNERDFVPMGVPILNPWSL